MKNDTSPEMTAALNALRARPHPTEEQRMVSLRNRLARLHHPQLADLVKDIETCPVPGVALKIVCAAQLIDEARATLSASIKANQKAAK